MHRDWRPYARFCDQLVILICRRSTMLDIIYLALGGGGFVALMLAARALGRL